MKTYMRVNLALLPLPLYLLVAWLVSPVVGAGTALVYALLWSILTRGLKLPPVFECALIAGLIVIFADRLVNPIPLIGQPNGLLLLCLSAGAAASLVMRRPWTAEFSASEYGGASQTQLFVTVNMIMSALWAVLFGWLGAAAFIDVPPLAYWLPFVLGAVVSVFLPNAIVAYSLKAEVAGDSRNNWTPPDFAVVPDRENADDEVCDVAIIGAGIGGLTAAALLADCGLKVSVFEQHVVPGGFSHTWLRRARIRDPKSNKKLLFRFDSGVHDVSGWQPGGPVRSVFERLGIAEDTPWKRLDHRYFLDGKTVSVSRDWRHYADAIAGHYPHEATGIRTLFEEIHDIYRAMYSGTQQRGGIPGSPATPELMLVFAKNYPLAVRWMERPWSEFVGRHLQDKRVLEWFNLLSGYITDEPEKAHVAQMVPLFGYYFEGGYYPVGGSGVIGKSLVSAIERRGGAVHLKTDVLKIVAETGIAAGLMVRDRLGAERRVRSGAVVCNGDLRMMLDRLLDDKSVADRLQAQTGPVRPACSAISTHLALRGELDLPPVLHVESGDDEAGLVIPSAVDPQCAPAGYSTMEAIQLVEPDEAKTWFPDHGDGTASDLAAHRRSAAYLERKKQAGDRLLACVRKVVPDVDERIIYRTDATPVTYARYTWTAAGSIYGVKTGDERMPTKMPLRNLVVAGAATHGPGVEAAIISGAYAAEALLPGTLASDCQTRSLPDQAQRNALS